jgi:hypothetical protein
LGTITEEDAPSATRTWCDEERLWVELEDGRQLGVPFGYYPRLMHATGEQRTQCELSIGGLHWLDLEEDISIAGLLLGGHDNTRLGREHHATCELCRASIGAPR